MATAEPALARRPPAPVPFRVLRRRRETEDTWTLTLQAADEQPYHFEPGQFTMLYAFGAGEVPISISGDPARPETLVHTVRAVGPTTRALCEERRGRSLLVRGPFGSRWPLAAAAGGDLVILAGGIGLAPLRPALYAALADRNSYGRVVLLYGAREPDQLLYTGELGRWARGSRAEVAITVDQAGQEWRGSVGVVTTLVPRASLDPEHTTALICGPEVMMRFAIAALLKEGILPERIHLSLERNMKCALGHCGRCQLGPFYVCGDGPVFPYPAVEHLLAIPEL
ncbi:MAG TPA: FAD/NAD(P)-binding protein [Gaiellaceae bacterium]|nr:FAD/NAD(P)-binding protein [Gaiellaceae bacterium]